MTEEEKDETTPAEGRPRDTGQMTEAELRAEIEKHFREQKVDEMLVQFMVTLTNLAYLKMGLTEDSQDIKDLNQASLAIDAFKSLLDTVGKRLPDQDAQALAGALSSMQMTYVKAGPEASGGGGGQANTEPDAAKEAQAGPRSSAAQNEQSGKSGPDDPASRLWVPGKE